jgi:hypothetical protein
LTAPGGEIRLSAASRLLALTKDSKLRLGDGCRSRTRRRRDDDDAVRSPGRHRKQLPLRSIETACPGKRDSGDRTGGGKNKPVKTVGTPVGTAAEDVGTAEETP